MVAAVAGVLRLWFCGVVRPLVAPAFFSLALPVSRLVDVNFLKAAAVG